MEHPADHIVNVPLGGGGGGSNPSGASANSKRLVRVELVLVAAQVIVSTICLNISKPEMPQDPYRALIISYAAGCAAALPTILHDYFHLDQTLDHVPMLESNICFQRIIQFETILYCFLDDDEVNATSENPSPTQMLVACWKILLNAYFGFWLIVAIPSLKIHHGTSSSSEPPLIFLTVLFFALGCVEYLLALIVSPILRISGALTRKGALPEWIDALPTHIFQVKKDVNGGGGVVAAGTDKECVISGDDAVCSICLGLYADNDELRELPCSHILHKDCVDKWLMIKATCPLCKCRICRRVPS